MKFLDKHIEKVVLLDLFTKDERDENRMLVVSSPLNDRLQEIGVNTDLYFPYSFDNFIDTLSFLGTQTGSGIVLQLSGHGNRERTTFGNNQIRISWRELLPYLNQIHNSHSEGLIVNASMMCYSDGLLQDVGAHLSFHAAVLTTDEASFQGLQHNINWYRSCRVRDNALFAIKCSIDAFEYSDQRTRYLVSLN